MSSWKIRHFEFSSASCRRRTVTGIFGFDDEDTTKPGSGGEAVRLVQHDPAAAGIDRERRVDELRQFLAHRRLAVGRPEEDHEAAAPGAEQLAAAGTPRAA